MCNGHYQLDMTHAFPSHFLLGHFNTATVANDPFVPDPFVFTAVAFPILYRAEDPFTEKAITLRLIRPVVDGFRLQYFPAGKFQYLFRGSEADSDS